MDLNPMDFFFSSIKKRKISQGFSELLKETDPLSLEHLGFPTLRKQAMDVRDMPVLQSRARCNGSAGAGSLVEQSAELRVGSAPQRHRRSLQSLGIHRELPLGLVLLFALSQGELFRQLQRKRVKPVK